MDSAKVAYIQEAREKKECRLALGAVETSLAEFAGSLEDASVLEEVDLGVAKVQVISEGSGRRAIVTTTNGNGVMIKIK